MVLIRKRSYTTLQNTSQKKGQIVPRELSLSAKYDRFRPNQRKDAEDLVSAVSQYDTVFFSAPTGTGKSLNAEIVARGFTSAMVVTESHALEAQYAEDGVPRLDGRGNFQCDLRPPLTVAQAPCNIPSFKCPIKDKCAYFIQRDKALRSRIFVTNYAWFLTYILKGIKFPNVSSDGIPLNQLVILDEAHLLFEALISATSLTIDKKFLTKYARKPLPADKEDRISWSKGFIASLKVLSAQAAKAENGSLFAKAEECMGVLERFAENPDYYVVRQDGDNLVFKPKTLDPVITNQIWFSAPKHLLMSASFPNDLEPLKEQLLIPMGVLTTTEVRAPSIIPIENRKVGVFGRANISSMREESFKDAVFKIDEVLAQKRQFKGVIYAHSDKLAQYIKNNSTFSQDLIYYPKGGLSAGLAEFRGKTPPSALIMTASAGHGISLDGDQARYLIFAKLPWHDFGDPWVLAQPDSWRDYEMVSKILQICGRVVRGPDDWATVYIVDALNFRRFYYRHRRLFPIYFQEAVYL